MEIPSIFRFSTTMHDCCFIACSGSYLDCARNFEVRSEEGGFKLCLRLMRSVVHRWQLRPTQEDRYFNRGDSSETSKWK